jgi:hypothetical protein
MFKALVIAALLLAQETAPLPSLHVIPPESLPTNYKGFDGKEIVVAGVVIIGPESMFMAVPTTSRPSEQDLMWVQMSSALAKNPGPLEAEYLRRQRTRGLVTAILRGRFQGADRRMFGHQYCCRFNLEITQVLSVG